jgi:predicted methyltransferase
VVVVLLAVTIPGCSGNEAPVTDHDSGDGAPKVSDGIRSAVEDPLRPAGDRERDADRRPAELLAFFGVEPGMRVADLQATHGFYTEILSTLIGPEGRVYAHNNDFVATRFGERLDQRLAKLREAGRTNIERVVTELDGLNLPSDLDAVLLIRFYHDLFWQPRPDGELTDRPEFLRLVFETLKPGGVFGVVDHHAEAGSGERDALDPRNGLHRIDVELVKREVLAAGFVLDAESDLLRHPEDTRDWNIFIDDRTRRDETDRFVLRFVKPGEGNAGNMNPSDLTGFATRYAAAWSSQDPDRLASFYAANGRLIVNDGAPSDGREAISTKAAGFMAAFPDMVVKMDSVSAEPGGRVRFDWTWTGTNTGPGGTGRSVRISGYELWTRGADGLILESQGNYDEAEYDRQMGGNGQ